MNKHLIAVAVATLLAGLSLTTPAFAGWITSYSVTLDIGQPVTNIIMLERTTTGSSQTWPFQADGNGTTLLTNPFEHDAQPTQSLLVGIVQDLVNDPPGQKHAVLLMDPGAASLANHIAWGTLFRNTLEDQLISNIKLATSGQDFPIIQPGLDAVAAFADGDAETGILDSLAQPHSAWFTPGTAFTVVSWSDGTVIGTGASTSTFVPEPTSLLAACGLTLPLLPRRRAKP